MAAIELVPASTSVGCRHLAHARLLVVQQHARGRRDERRGPGLNARGRGAGRAADDRIGIALEEHQQTWTRRSGDSADRRERVGGGGAQRRVRRIEARHEERNGGGDRCAAVFGRDLTHAARGHLARGRIADAKLIQP